MQPTHSQPNNLAAEMAVIGAAMMRQAAANVVVETLDRADYYSPANGLIHQALADLAAARKPVDVLTLSQQLRAAGVLDDIGGMGYLSEVSDEYHTTANVEVHCALIRDAAIRRRMIHAAAEITRLALDDSQDLSATIDRAERSVCGLAGKTSGKEAEGMRTLAGRVFDAVESRYNGDGQAAVMTNLRDLDDLLGGMRQGGMYILAARPGMGKTALGVTIATSVARHIGPVLIFSMEMDRMEIGQRMMAAEAGVNGLRLQLGGVRNDEWPRLADAQAALAQLPITIDDTPANKLPAMRGRCRKFITDHGRMALVVVDYLGLIDGSQGQKDDGNRVAEVGRISRGLKALAREFDAPVLALAQLNRAVESRTDKRPLLSDLRDSGSIEQDADAVLFIYRDEVYNPQPENAGQAEIIIAKNRSGPTGKARVVFNKELSTFSPMPFEIGRKS